MAAMHRPNRLRLTCCSFSVLFLASASIAALAGGGSSFADSSPTPQGLFGQGANGVVSYAPVGGNSSAAASETVDVSGAGVDYTVRVDAGAAGETSQNGGSASSVVGGTGNANGSGGIAVMNSERATSFTKGGNAIQKGTAETRVTIKVNGQTYVVVDDVATAVARMTQYGSSAAVSVDASATPIGNGYTVSQIITSKGSR